MQAQVNIYRYLVLGLSILNLRENKEKWYVSEVWMYPAGMQPVGFGPMPSTGLAGMYQSCSQTDPNIRNIRRVSDNTIICTTIY